MWDRLRSVRERVDQLERLSRRAGQLERDLAEARREEERLSRVVAKEQRDVQRLERGGISAMLANLFSDVDLKLDKERQEAAAALLKYEEIRARTASLQAELEQARRDGQGLDAARAEFERLLQARQEELARSGSPGAQELLAMDRQEQSLAWEVKQVDEAVSAGARADAALSSVAEAISSALNWGTVDMLGGNLLTGAMKHSRLDQARQHAHRAQQALLGFQRELQDVQLEIRPEAIGLDGFTRFADFFFDNLLTDWMIQSRIQESRQAVERSRRQIQELIDSLSRRKGRLESDLRILQRQREAFITDYPT